jgi:hypothetical protein
MSEDPQLPQKPSQNGKNLPQKITDEDLRKIKNSRNFVIAAFIASFFSLYLGSLLLSAVGIALAAASVYRLNKLYKQELSVRKMIKALRTIAIICTAMCAISFALNVWSIYLIYPQILEAAESGDFAALFGQSATSSSGASGSSTWG